MRGAERIVLLEVDSDDVAVDCLGQRRLLHGVPATPLITTGAQATGDGTFMKVS